MESRLGWVTTASCLMTGLRYNKPCSPSRAWLHSSGRHVLRCVKLDCSLPRNDRKQHAHFVSSASPQTTSSCRIPQCLYPAIVCHTVDGLTETLIGSQDGALELESAELRYETAAEGLPTEVRAKGEVPMTAVVAETMIFANSAVARRVHEAFPGSALLRRHPPPRPKAFREVRPTAASCLCPCICKPSKHGQACSLAMMLHAESYVLCSSPKSLCMLKTQLRTDTTCCHGNLQGMNTMWREPLDSLVTQRVLFQVVAELCEAGGEPLDTSSNAALSRSLAAAVSASGDPSVSSLINTLITRAMSEAEYFSAGAWILSHSHSPCEKKDHFWLQLCLSHAAKAESSMKNICCQGLPYDVAA
jgi:hypothetical protein